MCSSPSCMAPPFAGSLKCPFPQPDQTPVCTFMAPTLGSPREGSRHCLLSTAPIPLLSAVQLSMMDTKAALGTRLWGQCRAGQHRVTCSPPCRSQCHSLGPS